MPEPKEAEPVFKPEDLVTPPSCPPYVGGFGSETPEAKELREAAGDPPPRELKVNKPESARGETRAEPAKAEPAKAAPTSSTRR